MIESIPDRNEILAFAVQLSKDAGLIVKEARRNDELDVGYKDQIELVTSADIAVDELICSSLKAKYPGHFILSEESSPGSAESEILEGPTWIIDPIDGTVNFAYNQPQVAISIAFSFGGVVEVGIVHCPFLGETFSAIRGGGAYLNGEKIKTKCCEELERALVATGFPYKRESRPEVVERLSRVLSNCRDIRRCGAAAIDICWVGMGRIDAYYETVQAWDLAAGCLVAREAGARVGHLSSVPEGVFSDLWGKDLVVASPAIYDDLCDVLIG